ncbi:MAG TPA: hypothetical protein VNO30_12165 [Kofleriaceae bacterium]|nr:hypothetical protein [Kofleriaceae bacterium]
MLASGAVNAIVLAILVQRSAAPIVISLPAPEPPPPPSITSISVPITLNLAPPAPAPPAPPTPPAPRALDGDLGPCPARHTRAADVEFATLPEDISTLSASWFDTRLLAAWTGEHVYLSTDEGRSFQRVLDRAGEIGHVAFDCHGRLHVARVANDGTIEIGTRERDELTERWTRAAATHAVTHANGLTSLGEVRLVPYAGHVALLAQELGTKDRIAIVRRDERGRWRSTRLLERASYTNYQSWDGISFVEVEPRGTDRIRLLLMPWQGGECGYSEYVDATLNLRTLATSAKSLGEEAPEPAPERRKPDIAGLMLQDVAGRWLGFGDDQRTLVRLTKLQIAERTREHERD